MMRILILVALAVNSTGDAQPSIVRGSMGNTRRVLVDEEAAPPSVSLLSLPFSPVYEAPKSPVFKEKEPKSPVYSAAAPSEPKSPVIDDPEVPVLEPPKSPVYDESQSPFVKPNTAPVSEPSRKPVDHGSEPLSPVYYLPKTEAPLETSSPNVAPVSPSYIQKSKEPSIAPDTNSPSMHTEPPISELTEVPIETESPIAAPGGEPSRIPVASTVPTENPSQEVTDAPLETESPVVPPSEAPSASPVISISPTLSPSYSEIPSPAPTINPISSVNPSTVPSTSITSEMPSSDPSVTTDVPSMSPVLTLTPEPQTSAPISMKPVDITFSPSFSPSSMPSITRAIVFINELGTINGEQFVEIVYSSFLGAKITKYMAYYYNGQGNEIDSEYFNEGNFTANGMTFTYLFFPNTTVSIEAIALVESERQEVLEFLSIGQAVLAVDGPAAGMSSTDILAIYRMASNRRSMRGALEEDTESGTSLALVGRGCALEEFTFAISLPTPGSINAGQEILGCIVVTGPPTASPSLQVGGTDGITVGAIVGITASLALLLFVMLSFVRGRNESSRLDEEEEEVLTFDHPKGAFYVGAVEDFMADTADGEVDKLASTAEARSTKSSYWWNSVFSIGGVTEKNRSEEPTSTDEVSPSEILPLHEKFAEPDDSGLDAGGLVVAAAIGGTIASTESKTTARRRWLPIRDSETVAHKNRSEEPSSTEEVSPSEVLSPHETLAEPEDSGLDADGLVAAAAVDGTIASTESKTTSRRRWLPGRDTKTVTQKNGSEEPSSTEEVSPSEVLSPRETLAEPEDSRLDAAGLVAAAAVGGTIASTESKTTTRRRWLPSRDLKTVTQKNRSGEPSSFDKVSPPEVLPPNERLDEPEDSGRDAAGLVVAAAIGGTIASTGSKTTGRRRWLPGRDSKTETDKNRSEEPSSTDEVSPSEVLPPHERLAEPEDSGLDADGLVVAATVGGSVASTESKTKRRWIPGRNSKKATSNSEDSDADRSTDLPVVIPSSTLPVNASSIALSRKDDHDPATGKDVESVDEGVKGGLIVAPLGATGGAVAASNITKKRRGLAFGRGSKEEQASRVPSLVSDSRDALSAPVSPVEGGSEGGSMPLAGLDEASIEARMGPVEDSTAAAGLSSENVETKKNRSGWLFRRNTENKNGPAATEEPPPGIISSTDSTRPQAIPPSQRTSNVAALALARDEPDSDAEMMSMGASDYSEVMSMGASDAEVMSMTSAEATSDALADLDAALEKHDWNAIYDIAKGVSQKGSSHTDTFRHLAGSDAAKSDGDLPQVPGSPTDFHDNVTSPVPSTAKDDVSRSSSHTSAAGIDPSSAGWVGHFRRKKRTPIASGSGVSSGAIPPQGGRMPAEDVEEEDLVAHALVKSRPAKTAQEFEAFDRELKGRDLGPTFEASARPHPLEDTVAPLKDSMQNISSFDRCDGSGWNEANESSLAPSLADRNTEEAISKLIESKDWRGLGDFTIQEEEANERMLQSLQSRSMQSSSEGDEDAQRRTQREYEAAMIGFPAHANGPDCGGDNEDENDTKEEE